MSMDDTTKALAEAGYHLTLRSRAEQAVESAMGAVVSSVITGLVQRLEAGFVVVPKGTDGAAEWAQKIVRKSGDGGECELTVTLWLHRT